MASRSLTSRPTVASRRWQANPNPPSPFPLLALALIMAGLLLLRQQAEPVEQSLHARVFSTFSR